MGYCSGRLPGEVLFLTSQLIIPQGFKVDVAVLFDGESQAGVDQTVGLELTNDSFQLQKLLLCNTGT